MNKSLLELLNLIHEPNHSKCLAMLADYSDRFEKAPGSKSKHQNWPGGYLDHVAETMNIAEMLYDTTSTIRPLPFELGSAILVLFLHDLEKPFKYSEPTTSFESDEDEKNFVKNLIKKYEIALSPEEHNAFYYIHGEGDDYHPTKRIQGPLGAFVHICDTWSARIWFDYPRK